MGGVEFPVTNPVLIIALVMVTVLVAPLVSARFRVPGLVGLIVAGIFIGPHVLGLLARDLTMQVLGTIGLLYIMFLAGLDINLHDFEKYRNRSAVLGLLSFAVPQVVGTAMARTLLGMGWLEAVLLGSVLASHTLLAYPAVARLGLSRAQAVTVAVGATILTDTAALLVLAVVARSVEGASSGLFWLSFSLILALYVFAMLWGLPRFGQWFFRRIHAGEVVEFVFVLATAFTCSYLAEVAGVEAIIGAFLAGLGLNRLVPEKSPLMGRIRFVGDALFIPFFLISVGMLVDPAALAGDWRGWWTAGLMTITVIAAKWLAAAGTRPLFGYSRDEASLVFGLTVPQAAATLAATLIGYNLELFGEDVLNGSILMILVTCMLGPWVAERSGRRVALEAEMKPYTAGDAAQRILVPLANPATEPNLVDLALMIRHPQSDEPVFPLAIAPDGIDVKTQVAAGERLLTDAVMRIAAADVPVIPITRVDENVASGVVRAVKELLITTIVIGWSGRGAPSRFVFGSVLDELLSRSQEMVLVSKIDGPLNTVSRLVALIPPDVEREPGFDQSLKAVKQLATQVGSGLIMVAERARLDEIERHHTRTTPDVPTRFVALSHWGKLYESLDLERKRDDLIVLFSVREGTRAWRPSLQQLPTRLADQFEDAGLIVLHLPTYQPDGRPYRTGAPLFALREEYAAIDLTGSSAADLLQGLVRRIPEYSESAARALSSGHVPEIHPGVLFYHSHLTELREAVLLVGTCRPGVRISGADHPVALVLALLSPAGEPSERHLRRLAAVAKALHAPGIVDAVQKADSEGELVDIMAKILSSADPRDSGVRF